MEFLCGGLAPVVEGATPEQTAAMREYLSWEVDLPARIARDGSANFIQFQP